MRMKIVTAGKYSDVRTAGARAAAAAKPQTPGIFVPTLKNTPAMLMDWYWKGLREGGWIQRYLDWEKRTVALRMRRVARQAARMPKFNFKCDVQHKATVPLREFIRWRKTDPDFWADDRNLKSWKRDNPDAVVTC